MPSTVRNGISYNERLDVSEVWAEGAAGQTVRLLEVDWDIKEEFVFDMLGLHEMRGDQLHRDVPEQHPRWPWLYVNSMRLVTGFDNHDIDTSYGDIIKFDKALYQTEYTARPFEVLGDDQVSPVAGYREYGRYVEEKKNYTATARQWPGAGFEYDDTHQPLPGLGAIVEPVVEWEITWHDVPEDALPETAIKECLGRVNEFPFVTRTGAIAAERLLFEGVKREKYKGASGGINWLYRLHYLFKERTLSTWNEFPTNTGVFKAVSVPGSSPAIRPYRTADFLRLWTPPAPP